MLEGDAALPEEKIAMPHSWSSCSLASGCANGLWYWCGCKRGCFTWATGLTGMICVLQEVAASEALPGDQSQKLPHLNPAVNAGEPDSTEATAAHSTVISNPNTQRTAATTAEDKPDSLLGPACPSQDGVPGQGGGEIAEWEASRQAGKDLELGHLACILLLLRTRVYGITEDQKQCINDALRGRSEFIQVRPPHWK
jgi:hypothetical protein